MSTIIGLLIYFAVVAGIGTYLFSVSDRIEGSEKLTPGILLIAFTWPLMALVMLFSGGAVFLASIVYLIYCKLRKKPRGPETKTP